jgi:hypothetical protein
VGNHPHKENAMLVQFPLPVKSSAAVTAAIAATEREPDPIATAIERHKDLDERQYSLWCDLQELPDDSRELKEMERGHERAAAAAHEAACDLAKVKPTTIAGAMHLFLYVCDDASPVGNLEWHSCCVSVNRPAR